MTKNTIPCCAAEAMRRVRQVEVGGIVVGLAMLDDILDEVREMNLPASDSIADELLRQVKIYNYVPRPAETAYRTSLLREYSQSG